MNNIWMARQMHVKTVWRSSRSITSTPWSTKEIRIVPIVIQTVSATFWSEGVSPFEMDGGIFCSSTEFSRGWSFSVELSVRAFDGVAGPGESP
jgi:hypothetical protein